MSENEITKPYRTWMRTPPRRHSRLLCSKSLRECGEGREWNAVVDGRDERSTVRKNLDQKIRNQIQLKKSTGISYQYKEVGEVF